MTNNEVRVLFYDAQDNGCRLGNKSPLYIQISILIISFPLPDTWKGTSITWDTLRKSKNCIHYYNSYFRGVRDLKSKTPDGKGASITLRFLQENGSF